MKQRTPTARKWECVFPQPASALVDNRVDQLWTTAFAERTPFGDLRNQFRRHHCRTLNPYGSESCPYQPDVCAYAFLDTIEKTVAARPRVRVGYFIRVAKSIAARRADEKPLARDSTKVLTTYGRVRTDVSPTETEEGTDRLAEAGQEADGKGRRLRSPSSGPTAIGEVLGSIDLRPRERADNEGKEGTE